MDGFVTKAWMDLVFFWDKSMNVLFLGDKAWIDFNFFGTKHVWISIIFGEKHGWMDFTIFLEKGMDGFHVFFFWRKTWMDFNCFFGAKHG